MSDEQLAVIRAERDAVIAERDNLYKQLAEVSFMCEPHFRGATGRFMNAKEIIEYIASIGHDLDEAIERGDTYQARATKLARRLRELRVDLKCLAYNAHNIHLAWKEQFCARKLAERAAQSKGK